jgi:hypothetical protein
VQFACSHTPKIDLVDCNTSNFLVSKFGDGDQDYYVSVIDNGQTVIVHDVPENDHFALATVRMWHETNKYMGHMLKSGVRGDRGTSEIGSPAYLAKIKNCLYDYAALVHQILRDKFFEYSTEQRTEIQREFDSALTKDGGR